MGVLDEKIIFTSNDFSFNLCFSYLLIYIMQTKSIQTKNLQNQYLYIQAKNHMIFFKEYLKSVDLKDINNLKIDDDIFDIYANINKEKIDIFVKAKSYDISIYENLIR